MRKMISRVAWALFVAGAAAVGSASVLAATRNGPQECRHISCHTLVDCVFAGTCKSCDGHCEPH